MSLYKTMRCRYFDDSGHALKPYCSQGDRCRFIHPSDPQWKGGKESLVAPPSAAYESSKPKYNSSVSLPYRRPPPSSMVQQGDSSRSKQDDERDRERAHRERRKRDFEYLGRYIQERSTSLRRTSDRRSYSYHCSRSESKHGKSAVKTGNTLQEENKQDSRTDNGPRTTSGPSDVKESHRYTTESISGLFRSLTKLCTEVVQDAHTLAREEDKLKAFTNLSAELSQVSSDSAVTVAPTLAAVITSHRECKEKTEQRAQELESLWKNLFAALERDIVETVETRLNAAVMTLQKEGKNILHSVERSRSPTDNTLPAIKRRRIESSEIGSTSQELEESLRELLQGMKSQMDKQTEAIERLSKENPQVKLREPDLDIRLTN